VAVAEHSWIDRAGSSADGLGQTVAGGEVEQVTSRLGNDLGDAAAAAFTTGMRAGLALAAVGLLLGAASILAGSRGRAGAGPMPERYSEE